MDDHLTISFEDDHSSRPRPSPEAGTIGRHVDDTRPPAFTPKGSEAITGFGDGHRYRLVREIGRGGMGIVHEGWDSQLCRSVAIKIMDDAQQRQPGGLQRFLREAQIASQLSHPGIVTIHEFGVTLAGQAFIVMERLVGQTLRQLLKDITDRDRHLPGFLTHFSEVCQAMAFAHDRGVIHRDLKPSNIMVCPYGVVSVMDWGVAKVLAESDPGASFTTGVIPPSPSSSHTNLPAEETPTTSVPARGGTLAGTIFGTPAYLPPEQARGEVDRVDFRSDVFGLGSVLCEILTGRAPFTAENDDDRCRLAAAGDLRDAFERLDGSGCPLPLIRLVKRCLAAAPEARPADAGEVASAITKYLESGQRRAEQELVQFFDLSLDLFCIAGLNGTFHRLNDNVKSMLGYAPHELEGQPFLDYVHPDDRERTRRELTTLAEEIPTIHFLNRYRHRDGHYVWLEWNAHTAAEEGAVYAVARDVSERMAAAEVRRRLERERETIAAFTAAAGLFLTASGSLVERLHNVVEEGAFQLGLVSMEVWRCDPSGSSVDRVTTSSPETSCADPEVIAHIIRSQQPQQHSAADIHPNAIFPNESNFVGYPLVVGGQMLGLLGICTTENLSGMHLMAMSPLVTCLALAIAAER
jgi:PAS domain S-box-containing protein